MPPALEIYVLTKSRDLPTIDRFLDTFADRSAYEDRGNEEPMMVPLTDLRDETAQDKWTPETLSHAIERGLDYPRRAFAVYLSSKSRAIDRAYLAFTTDDQMVLGVSVDDTDERPENERLAKKLLNQLVQQSGAFLGIIMVEQPPPLSEREFRQKEGVPLTVHFWRDQSVGAHDHS